MQFAVLASSLWQCTELLWTFGESAEEIMSQTLGLHEKGGIPWLFFGVSIGFNRFQITKVTPRLFKQFLGSALSLGSRRHGGGTGGAAKLWRALCGLQKSPRERRTLGLRGARVPPAGAAKSWGILGGVVMLGGTNPDSQKD